jgi:hypothetical protein
VKPGISDPFADEDDSGGIEDDGGHQGGVAATNLRPQKPRRELERILDQLIFSQGCLQAYRRRMAPT